MAILQFAFYSGPGNDFLPHNYVPDLVAYTGTHDNDTFRGWWSDTQSTQEADVIASAHRYCAEYLEIDQFGAAELHWRAIRALMASSARLVVHPLQDVLGCGADARMNTPGKADGNWGWRVAPRAFAIEDAARLRRLTETFGRLAEAG
jgi:4-alpha-glucanotransferase